MLDNFHFLRPDWLWLVLPMALLLWALARAEVGGNAWRGIVDAHLLPRLLTDDGGRTRRLPLILLGAGWLLAVLALAGPSWERLPQPVYQAQAYRVLALDLSPSMNASDLAPSRLAHARFEVLDLLRKAGDGQTALLAYGAEPYVVSPLTSDTDTIAAQVPSLESGLLPVQGARRTDLALDKARELLQQAGAPDGEVILVTDGLDHPAAADEAARRLRAQGYRLSVLGVGTPKGAPVPTTLGGFLKDASGAILLPKLDLDALQSLAGVGGGRYVSAGPDDRDIETLIPSRSLDLTSQAVEQDTRADQWREEGPWLLVLLLPLAALGFRRGWLAPLALLVVFNPLPQAHAFGWDDLWLRSDQQAERLLQAGNPKDAANAFQRPDWRAAAQYQAGDYQQALDSLNGAADPAASYNRGNALARLGQLEQAVAAYDQALQQDPQDEDARHNRDLVQQLLDRKKQQEQQSQPNRNGQKSGDGQQDGQGPQGQQQSQGQQEQQNQGQQEKQTQGQQGKQDRGQQGKQDQGQQQSGQKQADGQNPEQQADQTGGREPGKQERQAGQGSPQDRPDQGDKQGSQARQDAEEPPSQGPRQAEAEAKGPDRRDAPAQMSPQPGEHPEEAAERPETARADAAKQPSPGNSTHADAPEPGLADLTGGQSGTGAPVAPVQAQIDPEDRQAMEQMLRRVEDDPGGLLRQRFLLQHLRRTGKL